MSKVLAVLVSILVCGVVSAQAKKLPYQQAQLLKDAKYYLDQSEGLLEAIDQKIGPMKVGDPSVQLRDVQTILNTTDKVAQYLKNADSRFKQLPADHPDVKAQADRYAALKPRLDANVSKATELKKGLDGIVNQGGTAEWKADFERLREINQMFGDPQILQTQPERAIDVIRQIPAVKAERARIAEKYGALMQQNTPESRDMKGVLNYFDERFGGFDRACQQFAAEAPAGIRKEISDATKMGEGAVAEKKHAFFGEGGGVAQQLGFAQTRLDVFSAIAPDSAEVAACKNELAAARENLKQMSASLQDNIIAANKVPNQTYSGGDIPALVAMIEAQWKEAGLPNEVLKTGINSTEWRRDTRWEWSSASKAWQKYDKSKLQGFIIIKRDDTRASVHYVNFLRNHLANDSVTAYWFNDPKEELSVTYLMLLSNVK